MGSFLALKINPNCGESVTLNHEKIGKYSKRIIKITTLINKHKLEGINYTSEKDDWKIFEKKNPTIALYVLYVKKEKIYPSYVSFL